jgi:hypothetical protein
MFKVYINSHARNIKKNQGAVFSQINRHAMKSDLLGTGWDQETALQVGSMKQL